MPSLSVSSFCLYNSLGPLHLDRRDDAGAVLDYDIPFPHRLDMEDFAVQAKGKLGIRSLELCQLQFQDASEERLDNLRSLLDDEGIQVTAVPIDLGNLTTPNDDHRSDDIERITQWFDNAKRLGAQKVRVNANAPAGGGNEVSGKVVDALSELSDRADKRGMGLLIENHGGASSDPDFVIGLLEAVGRDRLGLILDLGNFEPLIDISRSRIFGRPVTTDAVDLEPVYRNIEKLAPYASVVHAKSIDPAEDGSPLPDLDRALGLVAAAGYAGPVTIEWEGQAGDPWDNVERISDKVRTFFPALQ